MSSLLLRSVGISALAGAVAFACGDSNHIFVDTEASGGTGGTDAMGGSAGSGRGGKGGKGGSSGTTSGTAGEAGSGADGGTAGKGGGNGGSGNVSTAGEAGDTGVGGSTGGSQGGRGGTSNGNGGAGEGGQVIPDVEPGKPGIALVPGGGWMTSETYKLFGVMSEGQAPVNSSSTHYVLHGSVTGATQPGDATQ